MCHVHFCLEELIKGNGCEFFLVKLVVAHFDHFTDIVKKILLSLLEVLCVPDFCLLYFEGFSCFY